MMTHNKYQFERDTFFSAPKGTSNSDDNVYWKYVFNISILQGLTFEEKRHYTYSEKRHTGGI